MGALQVCWLPFLGPYDKLANVYSSAVGDQKSSLSLLFAFGFELAGNPAFAGCLIWIQKGQAAQDTGLTEFLIYTNSHVDIKIQHPR